MVILGFTVLMGVLASRIRVDPNILEMLPEDDPTTLAIQKLNEQEGGTNLLTIAISGEEGTELGDFHVGTSR